MKHLLATALLAAGLVASNAAAAPTHVGPVGPTYAFTDGRWWTGSAYDTGTMYSVDGVLHTARPAHIDETVDLGGRYVIPPFAEGHNHWVEPAKIDAYNACYLADGVYYVKDMGSIPFLNDQFRDKINLPTSVDLTTATLGFTAPGAHPVETPGQLIELGILPKTWKPDYDKQAELIVRTRADVDAHFKYLRTLHPAYVKVFLSFSEFYEQRKDDPTKFGNHRGLDPKLIPYIVKLAHAAHLRVAAHVYTIADYRAAMAAGVDEIAHLPGNGWGYEPQLPASAFLMTPADAAWAKRRGVSVTTTLAEMGDEFKDPARNKQLRDEVIIPNLKLLKRYGVPIMVGSDQFRHSSLQEMLVLNSLGVFSNAELLKMTTEETPRSIFPDRRLGRLRDGYEANFLVLDKDPLADFTNIRSIWLRVKQGRRLTLSASALSRPSLDCVG